MNAMVCFPCCLIAYGSFFADAFFLQVDTGELEEFDEKYLMDQCQLQVHQDMLNSDVIKPSQVRGIFYILLFAVMCSLAALLYQVRWARFPVIFCVHLRSNPYPKPIN